MHQGAARNFLQAQFGGPVEEKETTVATSTTIARATQNDPECVQLLFVNIGANTIQLGLTQAMATAGGIILNANGGNVSMAVRDDGTLPSREWWVFSPAGDSTLYVLKVRRYAIVDDKGYG